MVNNYFKSHPMTVLNTDILEDIYKNTYYKLDDEIGDTVKKYGKNIKILEIGYGSGGGAFYFYKSGFINYIGVDLDDTFLVENRKKFPGYEFLQGDINEFLTKGSKYDIIFMAHVFEHLDREQANRAVKLIYKSLNDGGIWINYMPNADSFKATTARYNDITHKTIYNTNSFKQIILSNDIKYKETKNKNTIAAVNPIMRILFKVINPIFVLFTKFYFLGMGYTFPRYYSSEILTIMKKGI